MFGVAPPNLSVACPTVGTMSDALRNDLEGAIDLGVAVEIHLTTGEKFLTSLHHWPEDEAWFSVWVPQTFGDDNTTRKAFRDQVSHWIVTDVAR